MSLDIERIRALYPALSDGYAWLDAAAGTQVPRQVVDAVAAAYAGGIGNTHGAFPASARSDAIVAEARRAVRRPRDRTHPAGRGHRGEQHPGHHARRGPDHRPGP